MNGPETHFGKWGRTGFRLDPSMALPSELISCILFELWSTPTSTHEYIQTFSMCSLVSKQWSAIIKEVNSTHLVIPLSYSGGYLYTIHSMTSIPQPLLCRTITFKVDYYIMKLYHVQNPGCRPSITTNRGIESMLQRLFYGPNTPPDGIHIYVHYLGDAQVHIPRFWLPLQATLLTIVYHYRWWVPIEFPRRIQCQCVQPTLARRVRQLCILGCADSWVMPLITPLTEWKCLTSLTTNVQLDISVPSFTVTTYDYPAEDMGTEYISRVMFGEREFSGTSLIRGSGLDCKSPYMIYIFCIPVLITIQHVSLTTTDISPCLSRSFPWVLWDIFIPSQRSLSYCSMLSIRRLQGKQESIVSLPSSRRARHK